jgi:hypothetical protein
VQGRIAYGVVLLLAARDYTGWAVRVPLSAALAKSAKAVSLGLIVTHAFPMDTQDDRVVVSYEIDGADWKLAVSHNGIGKPDSAAASAKGGLGTVLVKALARGPRCKGRSRHRPKWCERVAHARDLHLAATPNSLTAPKALFAMMVEGQT